MITESKDVKWYGIRFKLPKDHIPGAVPGTIPGNWGATSGGFFVPAKNKEEAEKMALKKFGEYRKKWEEHALTAKQVKALELRISKLTQSSVNEECLYYILSGTPKIGDKVVLKDGIYKVIKAHPQSDPMAYTKVNELPKGCNWTMGFKVAINPTFTYYYMLKKEQ